MRTLQSSAAPEAVKKRIRQQQFKPGGGVWDFLNVPKRAGTAALGAAGAMPIFRTAMERGLEGKALSLGEFAEARVAAGKIAGLTSFAARNPKVFEGPPAGAMLFAPLQGIRQASSQFIEHAAALTKGHLGTLQARGGVAKTFTLNPALQMGATNEQVLNVLRTEEFAHNQQMMRLTGGRMAIPGMVAGQSATPTTEALQGFLARIDPTFQAGLTMSQNNVLQLHLQHKSKGFIQQTFDLPVAIGERVSISDKVSSVKIKGIDTPVVIPGTSFTRKGATRFSVPKSVMEVVGSGQADFKIQGIKSGSEFYLSQLGDILEDFSRGDVAYAPGAARQFQTRISGLNRGIRKLLTTSADSNIVTALQKAHDVVPVIAGGAPGEFSPFLQQQLGQYGTTPRLREFRGSAMSMKFFEEELGTWSEKFARMQQFVGEKGVRFSGIKPELIWGQGVASTLDASSAMPFGQYEDPGRQIYQMFGKGLLAGGSSFQPTIKAIKSGAVRGLSMGRMTVPWFATGFQRGAENVALSLQGAPSQVMASVGIINDPNFFRAGVSGELPLDAMSGDLWVSKRFARSLTRDISNELNRVKPGHAAILDFVGKHGEEALFSMREGKQLLEAGGLGTSLMLGRYKHTISGVFDEDRLTAQAQKAGIAGAVPQVVFPAMKLGKYPGGMREMVLGTMLERAVGQTMPKFGAGQLKPRYRDVSGIRKTAGFLSEVAGVLEARVVMAPEVTKDILSDQIAGGVSSGRFKELVEREVMHGGKVDLTLFQKHLQEGYVPQFLPREDLAAEQAAKGLVPGFQLDAAKAGQVEEIFRRHGLDPTIGQEQILAPTAQAGGKVGAYTGYMGVMSAALRKDSMQVITRISPVSNKLMESATLLGDDRSGFKLQTKTIRRLGLFGAEGEGVADELRSIYKTQDIESFGKQFTMFEKMMSGHAPSEELLGRMNIPTFTADEFISKYGGQNFQRVGQDLATEGTYFSDRLLAQAPELKHGFVLQMDQPLRLPLLQGTGDAVMQDKMYMLGPAFHSAEIEAEGGLSRLARSEEQLFLAMQNKHERSAADLVDSTHDYWRAFAGAAGGKSGMVARRWFQPRLAGGTWTNIMTASKEITRARGFDDGTAFISEAYAKELGIEKYGSTMEVKGQRYKYAWGLTQRDPIQGAYNVASVRYVVDDSLAPKGRGVAMDPEFTRRALGDTDRDTIQVLFGNKNLQTKLEALGLKQFGHFTSHEFSEAYRREIIGEIAGDGADSLSLTRLLQKEAQKASEDIGKDFTKAQQFLFKLESAHDMSFYREHVLKIASTKMTTGQINVGHEILRSWLGGTDDITKFVSTQYGGAAARLRTKGAAGQLLGTQEAFALHMSNILGMGEEMASIKKSSTPQAQMLELLEEAAARPFSPDLTGSAYESWKLRAREQILRTQHEIFGSKQLVPINTLANVATVRDATSFEDMMTALRASSGFEDRIAEVDALSGWMARSMRHMNEAYQRVAPGEAMPFGRHIDAIAEVMGNTWGVKQDNMKFQVLSNMQGHIDAVREGLREGQLSVEQARTMSNALLSEASEFTHNDFEQLARIDALADDAADAAGQRATANFGKADQVMDNIAGYFSKMNPFTKWSMGIGAGILGLAAIKNQLYPDVYPAHPAHSGEQPFHNPPFLGYPIGPGFHDSIPPPMARGGMNITEAPSFGAGRELPYHNVMFDRGMTQERPVPAMVQSRKPYVPTQPAPISSGYEGGGQADLGPHAVVTKPMHMRPMAQPGLNLGGSQGAAASVNFRGSGSDTAQMEQIAMMMGSMTGADTNLSIMNDVYAQSDLELGAAMRSRGRGRIHRNPMSSIEHA